ncbi:uncharacterized protein [Ptychodera flava]|uniref:uncharacterized protein n=1 Tax=Ptychodera flava TaxID=63121 RepID=UPI00396A9167
MEMVRIKCALLATLHAVCIGIVASKDTLSLVNGVSPYEGIVEVYIEDEWARICDTNFLSPWQMKEADVVCRQLGHPGAMWASSVSEGDEHDGMWLLDIDCNGDEESIQECSYDVSSEPQSSCNSAGVTCNYAHYIGCFDSSVNNPTLSERSKEDDQSMTIEACLEFCRSEVPTAHAGVQAGSWCYCGDEFELSLATENENCDSSCTGNDTQACGGTVFLVPSRYMGIYDVSMGDCGGSSLGSRGTVYSPGFPGRFDQSTLYDCAWHVTAPNNTVITSDFIMFDIKEGYFVEIVDVGSGEKQTFTENDDLYVGDTSFNRMDVKFYNEGQPVAGSDGIFALEWEAIYRCYHDGTVEHGTVYPDDQNRYDPGETLLLTCDIGHYPLTNVTNVTCLDDGTWNDELSDCIAIDCGEPDDIDNAEKYGDVFTYNSTVSYKCHDGYTIEYGDGDITCQADGQWSEQPMCIESPGDPTARYVGAFFGIIAILAIVGIIIALAVLCYRSHKAKNNQHPDDNYMATLEDAEPSHHYDVPKRSYFGGTDGTFTVKAADAPTHDYENTVNPTFTGYEAMTAMADEMTNPKRSNGDVADNVYNYPDGNARDSVYVFSDCHESESENIGSQKMDYSIGQSRGQGIGNPNDVIKTSVEQSTKAHAVRDNKTGLDGNKGFSVDTCTSPIYADIDENTFGFVDNDLYEPSDGAVRSQPRSSEYTKSSQDIDDASELKTSTNTNDNIHLSDHPATNANGNNTSQVPARYEPLTVFPADKSYTSLQSAKRDAVDRARSYTNNKDEDSAQVMDEQSKPETEDSVSDNETPPSTLAMTRQTSDIDGVTALPSDRQNTFGKSNGFANDNNMLIGNEDNADKCTSPVYADIDDVWFGFVDNVLYEHGDDAIPQPQSLDDDKSSRGGAIAPKPHAFDILDEKTPSEGISKLHTYGNIENPQFAGYESMSVVPEIENMQQQVQKGYINAGMEDDSAYVLGDSTELGGNGSGSHTVAPSHLLPAGTSGTNGNNDVISSTSPEQTALDESARFNKNNRSVYENEDSIGNKCTSPVYADIDDDTFGFADNVSYEKDGDAISRPREITFNDNDRKDSENDHSNKGSEEAYYSTI